MQNDNLQEKRVHPSSLIRELSDWYADFVEKKLFLSRDKHPLLFKIIKKAWPIIIIFAVCSTFGVPKLSDFSASTQPQNQVVAVGGLDCEQFNPVDWDRGQGQLDFDGSIWSVATGSPNGLLRFKEKIPLNQDIEVTFVPNSEKQVNFVITMHDIYELIIGDGGYQGITLKTSKGDGQQMRFTTTVDEKLRVIFEDGQMEPGADVKVILNQGISRLENGSYELNLRIARATFLEPSPNPPVVFATYSFPLPPHFNYKNESAWFSLGLKAASDSSLVASEILCVDFIKDTS